MCDLKFSEPKNINVENSVKKIFVKTIDDKPLRIITEKCDSFGVERSDRFNTKSMCIILGEESVNEVKEILVKIEDHLGKSLSKV